MIPPVLLCVDDRPQLLQLRKSKLAPLGYSIVTAADSATAIAVLKKMPVAAVLLEYKAEGMDAEAVAFHIKQQFPTEPIILLSAYADMPERVFWLVDEFVMRSDSVDQLANVIDRVTGLDHKLTPQSVKALTRAHAAG